MKHASPALLPPGFQDLLPPDSDREAYLIQIIGEVYKSFGYRFVKPPLMEFEGSFTASPMGRELSDQTFRLMDPVSHAMLVLRADITPQIVRLAETRMPNSPRPLRLFYAADSMRVKAGQIRTARQFTQIGCECIGVDDVDADLEICLLALLSLKALDLEDITLDLAVPGLVPAILSSLKLDDARYEAVKKSLGQKDLAALSDLNPETDDLFRKLLAAVGPAEAGLKNLRAIDALPQAQMTTIQRMQDVVEKLATVMHVYGLGHVSITVDPLETLGFDYHTGLGFTLFSKTIQGELGRGGRYKARFADDNLTDNHAQSPKPAEDACGFSLYTDNLRKLVKHGGKPNRLFVPADTPWQDIKAYQDEGWKIIRQTGPGCDDKTLKDMGCTHKIESGKAVKLNEIKEK